MGRGKTHFITLNFLENILNICSLIGHEQTQTNILLFFFLFFAFLRLCRLKNKLHYFISRTRLFSKRNKAFWVKNVGALQRRSHHGLILKIEGISKDQQVLQILQIKNTFF